MAKIKRHIVDGSVRIVITDQLLTEIKNVIARDHLKKYFPKSGVKELIELLETIAEKVEIEPRHFINRDVKDNFLLDLIDFSKADYLVTGDKDLLLHNPFKTARILNPADFEIEMIDRI